MENFLEKIVAYKKKEVEQLMYKVAADPFHPIHAILKQGRPLERSFESSLKSPGLSVIAEVKRKSPVAGQIGEIPDPTSLARLYVEGGAVAISVLTDGPSFGGSLEDLIAVRKCCSLPLLRKDFTIDSVQIAEAAVVKAAAVLIIVAVTKGETQKLLLEAARMGLEALVEVTNEEELKIALYAGARIIGVNTRDLTTFKVDTQKVFKLKEQMPDEIVSVAASGIKDPADGKRVREVGYDAVLIGQALVEAANPIEFIRKVRGAK